MDLNRLNNTVEELEESSKQLAKFSKAYSELKTLQADIAKNNSLINGYAKSIKSIEALLNQTANETTTKLTTFRKDLEKSTKELNHEKKDLNAELEKILSANFKNQNAESQAAIRKEFTLTRDAIEASANYIIKALKADLEKQLNQRTTQDEMLLERVNSISEKVEDSFKEILQELPVKFEAQYLEIQSTAQNERVQDMEAIDASVNSAAKLLETKFEQLITNNAKQIQTLTLLMYVLIALCISIIISQLW